MAAGDLTDTLVDRVRSRTGQPSKQGILDDEILAYLNRGQMDLHLRLNDNAMPLLKAQATGNLTASRVALPTDFSRMVLVRIGADKIVARPWEVLELDTLEDNVYHLPSLSNPYYFLWYNATDEDIRLQVEVSAPASTAAYIVDYIKRPAEIDTDTDPVYSTHLHNLLVDFAVARCREQRKEYPEARRVTRLYYERIMAINTRHRTLPGPYEEKPHDAPAGDI